jgi:hypothetical protein
MAAVLINQSSSFAFCPQHLFKHDAALVSQNAEDTVQMHPILQQDADTSHNETTTQPGSNIIQAPACFMLKSGQMY